MDALHPRSGGVFARAGLFLAGGDRGDGGVRALIAPPLRPPRRTSSTTLPLPSEFWLGTDSMAGRPRASSTARGSLPSSAWSLILIAMTLAPGSAYLGYIGGRFMPFVMALST